LEYFNVAPKSGRQSGIISQFLVAAIKFIIGNPALLNQVALLICMLCNMDMLVSGFLLGHVVLKAMIPYAKKCKVELVPKVTQCLQESHGLMFFLYGDWRSLFVTHAVIWNPMWSGILKSTMKSGFKPRPAAKPPDKTNQIPPAPDPEVQKVYEVRVRLKYQALERTMPSVLPLLDKLSKAHAGEANCFHALLDKVVNVKPYNAYQVLFDRVPPLRKSTRNIRILEIQGYLETYLVVLPYHILLRWPYVLLYVMSYTAKFMLLHMFNRVVLYFYLKYHATKEKRNGYGRNI